MKAFLAILAIFAAFPGYGAEKDCTGFEGTIAYINAKKDSDVSIVTRQLSPDDSRAFLASLRQALSRNDLMLKGAIVGFANNIRSPQVTGVFVYDDKGCSVGANFMGTDQVKTLIKAIEETKI